MWFGSHHLSYALAEDRLREAAEVGHGAQEATRSTSQGKGSKGHLGLIQGGSGSCWEWVGEASHSLSALLHSGLSDLPDVEEMLREPVGGGDMEDDINP